MKRLIFLIFLLSSVALLVNSTNAQIIYYDQFNGPAIDPSKWRSWQIREIREINGDRKFFSKMVAYGFADVPTNRLYFKNAAYINHIEADVTITEIDGNYGPNANGLKAEPSAYIGGHFYNDGTGNSTSFVGEVIAQVKLRPDQNQLLSEWSVLKFTNSDGSSWVTLGSGILSSSLNPGDTYKLSLDWDPLNNIFIFRDGVSPQKIFEPGGTAHPANIPAFKGLNTTVTIADTTHHGADPSLWGKVSATFDNVMANGQDGQGNPIQINDDFSSAKLDPTKWGGYYEGKSEVFYEQLISKARNTNSTGGVANHFHFRNPEQINEIQAKVVLQEAVKSPVVQSQARVGGFFYNDTGVPNSGYSGDVWAQVTLYPGLLGQNPFALWSISRANDPIQSTYTTIAYNTFPLAINFNQPYNLYIKWDGTEFIFKVNNYAVSYTPTTSIFLANHPKKSLSTNVNGSNTDFDVSITAAFDDVIVGMAQFTPMGTNIDSQPMDSTTETNPVTLTFSQVTQAGTTSLSTSNTGPTPPSGFQLGDPPTYYDLSTTAVVSGPRTICINYSNITYSDESQLRLLHYENDAWIDITSSQDMENNIICGVSSSFSPFAIVEPNVHKMTLGPGNFWIGLKNSDDQGTQFDLKTELYKNGVLISKGETLCITGVTRNPSPAKEVVVPSTQVLDGAYDTGDSLSLKVFTRIGTNSDGSKCSGPGGSHNNAVGLRLYYDVPSQPSKIRAQISPSPIQDFFMHSTGGSYFLNNVPPNGAVKYKDSTSINFNNGNLWKEIGTWNMTLP